MICHATDEVTSVHHFQRYVIKRRMMVSLSLAAIKSLVNPQNSVSAQMGGPRPDLAATVRHCRSQAHWWWRASSGSSGSDSTARRRSPMSTEPG